MTRAGFLIFGDNRQFAADRSFVAENSSYTDYNFSDLGVSH